MVGLSRDTIPDPYSLTITLQIWSTTLKRCGKNMVYNGSIVDWFIQMPHLSYPSLLTIKV